MRTVKCMSCHDVGLIECLCFAAKELRSFRERIGALREIAEASIDSYHPLIRRHELALKTDVARTLIPGNYYGQKLAPAEYHDQATRLGLWGPPEFQRKLSEWRKAMCRAKETNQVTSVSGMDQLPFVSETSLLFQRSFSMSQVGHNTDLECPVFPDNGQIIENPYCDLRRCNQRRFPFVYVVISHRNRPDNLVRIVQSIRNSTEQCENPPEWVHCLCVYVSDYGTSRNVSLASRLSDTWNGHVRLLARTDVTEPFSRGSVSNL